MFFLELSVPEELHTVFSVPVELYTVYLHPSRTVHCIFGSKKPCQKPGQKPGRTFGQFFWGCLLIRRLFRIKKQLRDNQSFFYLSILCVNSTIFLILKNVQLRFLKCQLRLPCRIFWGVFESKFALNFLKRKVEIVFC